MLKRSRAILVLACGLNACGGAEAPAAEHPETGDQCSDFELDVERVWSEQARVRVEAGVMNHWQGKLDTEVAEQRAHTLTTKMDDLARDWVMLRRSVCLDHFKRGLGTSEEYQAKAGCFDRLLARQRAVVAELQRDPDAGSSAMDGLNQELDRCR